MGCLASRMPWVMAVTVERLAMVEAAEAALRAAGLRQGGLRAMGAEAAPATERHG